MTLLAQDSHSRCGDFYDYDCLMNSVILPGFFDMKLIINIHGVQFLIVTCISGVLAFSVFWLTKPGCSEVSLTPSGMRNWISPSIPQTCSTFSNQNLLKNTLGTVLILS